VTAPSGAFGSYGHLTLAGGVRASVEVFASVARERPDGLETVRRLVASYELGATSGSLDVCKNTFPDCKTDQLKLAPVSTVRNDMQTSIRLSSFLAVHPIRGQTGASRRGHVRQRWRPLPRRIHQLLPLRHVLAERLWARLYRWGPLLRHDGIAMRPT